MTILKQRMRELKLDAVYGLDWETFWSQDYTLSKLATTDYIYDQRFETQLVAVQKDSWAKPKVMEIGAFRTWAKTINWSRAGMLAHHAQFDGLIAHKHFGIQPAFFFDTLSMARALMPINVPRRLDSLARALGFAGKVHGAALTNTKGKRWAEFTKQEKAELKVYAGDDISDTWGIFVKLLEYMPLDELRLIDVTLKLYCRPRLLIDKPMMQGVLDEEINRKARLLEALNTTAKDLGSDPVFAEKLAALGVEPPTKWSDKKRDTVFAFAKNDLEFKELLDHENEDVVALVEARLNIKSKMVESRAARLVGRADYGPQPIYLNYWGAGPGRWSGGDGCNWQNLKRGSDIRKAIHAPPGYQLIIADLAQIEARINAWTAGQSNIVSAFHDYDVILGYDAKGKPIRKGPDIYRLAAALIFGKRPEEVTDAERFIGKTAVLGLGYGAGAPKFATMLKTAAGAPKEIVITDAFARDIHSAWRQSNQAIVANWKATGNKFKQAWLSNSTVEDGIVSYERSGDNMFMHMPGGMAIRYDGVELNGNDMDYIKVFRVNKTKEPTVVRGRLYGGLLVENRTQGFARRVVAEHALAIADEVKSWQLVMTTHDELVGLVPNRSANKALKIAKAVMSQAPSCAPGLPIAVDAHISQRYDK